MNSSEEKVILADVATVHVSVHNTRQPTLKQVTATGLLDSIREQGQITPAVVRPHPEIKGEYELAAGARRHTACTGLAIPLKIIVREMTDGELLDAILTDNLQREDPEPEAEADLIQRRLDEGLTPEEIGARYGKDELWVKRRMKILAVIPALRKLFKPGKQLDHFSTGMKERIGDLEPAMQKSLSNQYHFPKLHSLDALKDMISNMACSLEGQDFVNDPATAVAGCSDGCATDTSQSLFAEDKKNCGNCLNSKCFAKRKDIAINLAIAALIGDKPLSGFVLYTSKYVRGGITFKGQELRIRDKWEVEQHYVFSKKKTEELAIDFAEPTKPKFVFLTKKEKSASTSSATGKPVSREEKLTARRLGVITTYLREALEIAPVPTLIPILNLVATFGTSANRTYVEGSVNQARWDKAVSGLEIEPLSVMHRHDPTTPEEVLWHSVVSVLRQRLDFSRNLDLLSPARRMEITKAAELIEFPYEAEWNKICTEEVTVPKSWGPGIDPVTLESGEKPEVAKKAAKKKAKKSTAKAS